MKSMGNEGNFQNNFIKLMDIYGREKTRRKFSVFRKTSLYGTIFTSAYSPLFDEAKNIVFILVTWPGESQQPIKCMWLTVFLQVQNKVKFYVKYCKIRLFSRTYGNSIVLNSGCIQFVLTNYLSFLNHTWWKVIEIYS